MRTHAEAVRDGLKLFLLFVDAAAAPPEPGLMNERSVRRIHQADNSVIDVRRQFAGQMRDFEFIAEGR